MIVELKWNRTADRAVEQIKDKKYAEKFRKYGGDILLVGISYNDKTRKHKCSIVTLDTLHD